LILTKLTQQLQSWVRFLDDDLIAQWFMPYG
jgi:hypothetical protein